MKRLLNLGLLWSVGATGSIADSIADSIAGSAHTFTSNQLSGDGGGRQQDSVQVKTAPSHRELSS